ncbi:MAG: cytochrome-c peroxidase [Lewinellaceae bacterium]|nr:hypothetical protein [Phaeodactylibacter sp.]MCB9035626.1 cytochrome-c peroxidase [Lewinellaceae bacterium]
MKTFTISLFLLALFTALGPQLPGGGPDETAQRVAQAYAADFRLFQEAAEELAEMADNHAAPLLLRRQITETRMAFKRVEFLFDYNKTYYNQLHINGPPLPKVDKENVNGDIVPPNGLQALDELIFSEEAKEQGALIEKLASDLKVSADFIAQVHLPLSITDAQVVEALRSGVIRVFTLGLTGFDTPGSGNAIPEAMESMLAMEKAFLLFEESVKPEARKPYQEAKKLFRKAYYQLAANQDFDSFGRMDFLKQAVNPLYAKLLDFQRLNGIAVSPFKYQAQNFLARNLFEEDFLDTYFYSELSYLPLNNPASIALGKTLFYDPILSGNGKMSCATCHDPARAFTDGLPKSKTHVPGKFTRRNSPTLVDATFSSRYFWDMRELTLERQVGHVISDTLEFNTDFYQVAERLEQSETYVRLFKEVYGGIGKKDIYSRSISNALAAYVNSLTSFNSEFDRYARNESAAYPREAIRGFDLFMGKAACGTCHFAPVFNGSTPPFYTETDSEVLGVTLGFDTLHPQLDPDPGRGENGLRKDARPHYLHSFKTVTVRNAALTAPYMHNGSFNTLEEVLEFYNRGGGAGMGLEIDNQTLPPDPLNLSEREKADIIAFLHTLTDTSGLTVQHVVLPEFEGHPEWR